MHIFWVEYIVLIATVIVLLLAIGIHCPVAVDNVLSVLQVSNRVIATVEDSTYAATSYNRGFFFFLIVHRLIPFRVQGTNYRAKILSRGVLTKKEFPYLV